MYLSFPQIEDSDNDNEVETSSTSSFLSDVEDESRDVQNESPGVNDDDVEMKDDQQGKGIYSIQN